MLFSSARPSRALAEPLEARKYFVVLAQGGTTGPDEIIISVSAGNVNVSVNGVVNSVPDSTVTGIEIQSFLGNDSITIQSNTDNPVTILAGEGDDTITAQIDDPSFSSPVFAIDGGPGTDSVLLADPNNMFQDRWTVTDTSITRTFFAGLNYTTIENLTLTCGPVLNRIDINSTAAGVYTLINGGGGDDDFRVLGTAGTPVLIDGQSGLDDVTVNNGATGTAMAALVAGQDLDAVNVQGGLLKMGAASADVATMHALTIGPAGQFDVGLGAGIVDWTDANAFLGIRTNIVFGHNNGSWNGPGIISSDAQTQTNTGVGLAETTQLFTSFPAMFNGVSVDDTTVIFRHTLYGDANLDHTVNISDFSNLAANFNQSPLDWYFGDFNFDSTTNISDFSVLAGNFNNTLPRATAAIPGSSRIDRRTNFSRVAVEVL